MLFLKKLAKLWVRQSEAHNKWRKYVKVSFRWKSLLFGGSTVIKALQIRGSSKCGLGKKQPQNKKKHHSQ